MLHFIVLPMIVIGVFYGNPWVVFPGVALMCLQFLITAYRSGLDPTIRAANLAYRKAAIARWQAEEPAARALKWKQLKDSAR